MQDEVNEKTVAISIKATKLTAALLQAAMKKLLNIKAFESTAKKYGVDFALKKDATETPPRYLVFFKGRDADVLTAAFKEFSAKKLTQEQKPSIRKALAAFKEKAKQLNANREKVKNKDRGREL